MNSPVLAEFDICEAAELIRADLADLELEATVRVQRRKRQNSKIAIRTGMDVHKAVIEEIAKKYIGLEWNDFHEAYRLNFEPVLEVF